MIRHAFTAAFVSLLLAACGNTSTQPDTAEDANLQSTSTAAITESPALPDPYETLFPWAADAAEVTTTQSGLQYRVIRSGDTGGQSPGINDTAVVNYDGRLASDGTKFDSSYDRGSPAEFGVGQVISGWTEALQLMKPGDEWMLYIPSDIAYGANPRPGGPIPPNADLMFRVQLLDVKSDDTPGASFWATYAPWNSSAEGVQTTSSGLEYIVLTNGQDDTPHPELSDGVILEFDGRLAEDGRRFDSSFGPRSPDIYPVENTIPGWTEALQLMRPGDEWIVYRPAPETDGPPAYPDLMMRIKLDEIYVPEQSDSAAWERLTPWDSAAEGVQKTESGLEYVVLEAGPEDGSHPTTANRVSVYYEGRLAETGETFDSAYARGEPIEFGVTQVIPGWTEALQLMRPGDRWMVYLPADIAYGASGRPGIPPNSDLIFEVQLVDVL